MKGSCHNYCEDNPDGANNQFSELREYKEHFMDEKHWLEHILNKCHCKQLAGQDFHQLPLADSEKRMVELDVLFEAIDALVDLKNSVKTGHPVRKVMRLF